MYSHHCNATEILHLSPTHWYIHNNVGCMVFLLFHAACIVNNTTGSYSKNNASTSCTPCDEGYYQSSANQTSCSPCPVGTYCRWVNILYNDHLYHCIVIAACGVVARLTGFVRLCMVYYSKRLWSPCVIIILQWSNWYLELVGWLQSIRDSQIPPRHLTTTILNDIVKM